MRYLVTGKEMSLYDKQTSEHFRVPSVVLMEQAAHAFVEQLMSEMIRNDSSADAVRCQAAGIVVGKTVGFVTNNKSSESAATSISASHHILVVCGTGNNGGDGIAVARLLNQRGLYTEIYAPVEGHRTSELFELQYKIYQAYGYPVRKQLNVRQSIEKAKIAGLKSSNVAIKESDSGLKDGFAYEHEVEINYDFVIDAIFGTGLSKPITGKWADVIECMNAMPGRKIAVDIASGVSADTGAVLGTAFQADETITFSFAKLGQYLWPGASCSGKVTVVPIGITEESFLGTAPHVRALEESDLNRLPSRKPNSHKGSYGKLLVIAGSAQMAGAAIFAAKAAYRMGTGLVKVMTPESNRVIIQTQVPEAILSTYPDNFKTVYKCGDNKSEIALESNSSNNLEKIVEIYNLSNRKKDDGKESRLNGQRLTGESNISNDYELGQEWNNVKYHELHEQIRKELTWADALVIGPGIGTGEIATEILSLVLKESKIPMVLDADALNIISREGWQPLLSYTLDRYQSVPAEDTESRQDVSAEPKDNNQLILSETCRKSLHQDVKPRCNIIITPHMGEMSRLTGKPTGEIKAHICEEASRFSADHQVVCVLKDARTVTATPDGSLYLNLSGNNGMATAGSGDVLSGILGGLLAQGLDPVEAAPLGVYFHGRAGDTAKDRLGARYMMASDIIEGMSEI